MSEGESTTTSSGHVMQWQPMGRNERDGRRIYRYLYKGDLSNCQTSALDAIFAGGLVWRVGCEGRWGQVHSGNNVTAASWQQCGSTEENQNMDAYLCNYVIYSSEWQRMVNTDIRREKRDAGRESMTPLKCESHGHCVKFGNSDVTYLMASSLFVVVVVVDDRFFFSAEPMYVI